MLFVISKLAWQLIQPSHVILALLGCGVLLGRSRWAEIGYWFAALGTALLVAVTLLPIPNLLLATLEDRFPLPQHLPDHVDGIIVLGGAIDPVETAARGIPSLNDAAERMTAFVKLARLYPAAPKLFTGGIGTLRGSKISEADAAKMLFADFGLDNGQVLFEGKSRNTYENAVFSQRLVHPSQIKFQFYHQCRPHAEGCRDIQKRRMVRDPVSGRLQVRRRLPRRPYRGLGDRGFCSA